MKKIIETGIGLLSTLVKYDGERLVAHCCVDDLSDELSPSLKDDLIKFLTSNDANNLTRSRRRPKFSDCIELELKPSHDPKGFYVMHCKLGGDNINTIWCDRISCYKGSPPVFVLHMCGVEVSSVCGRVLRVDPDIVGTGIINDETMKILGKYVEIERR